MTSPKLAPNWTAAISETEYDPSGPPRCMARALERLGPFKYKTHDEACRYQAPRPGIHVSEELAFDRIVIMARHFNRIELLSAGAPRRKNVVENLNALEQSASEFADFLESLDDFTRRCLHTAGSGLDEYRLLFTTPAMQMAGVDELPRPATSEDGGNNCEWITTLRALSQYAGFVRTNFLLSKGVEDPDKPDKGGNTNLVKELYGSARHYLVQEGWQVFDLCRPDEAAGTEGGLFHLFLCDVFEFATGKEPAEHSKLMPFIKKACTVNRRIKELRRREYELMEMRDETALAELSDQELHEIDRELIETVGAISRLFAEMWSSKSGKSQEMYQGE